VPETIEAIRALTGVKKSGAVSIARIDQTMGLSREFLGPEAVLA
jgi:hypothetical protein